MFDRLKANHKLTRKLIHYGLQIMLGNAFVISSIIVLFDENPYRVMLCALIAVSSVLISWRYVYPKFGTKK